MVAMMSPDDLICELDLQRLMLGLRLKAISEDRNDLSCQGVVTVVGQGRNREGEQAVKARAFVRSS